MELLNINILNPNSRKYINTYVLTDECYSYFGAYTYLNVAKAVNDPINIQVETTKRMYNATNFSPVRYGNN